MDNIIVEWNVVVDGEAFHEVAVVVDSVEWGESAELFVLQFEVGPE